MARFMEEESEWQEELTTDKLAISSCTHRSFVSNSIHDHQAVISSTEESMDSCFLPVLACHSVQDQLSGSCFEMEIYKAGSYVPLKRLTQVYARCGGRTIDDASEISQYLLPAADGGHTSYLWYWEGKDGFNPYGASVSELLEQALPSNGCILLSIDQNEYEIDTCSMTQTNTSTKRVRLIERRMKRFISVQIWAYSDYLQEVPCFVRECLLRNFKEATVSIPPVCQNTNSVDHLLQVAQRRLVFTQKTPNNSSIFLQGEMGVVTDVELELAKEILWMKETLKTPDNWEPQEYACELKLVGHHTAEWNRIEHMIEPKFNVFCIERIQNQWHWEMYEQSRQRMSEKNSGEINEKWLFHGTKSIPPVKIYNSEQGFDNRLSSRGMWGEGTYFADRADYSASFAHTTCDGYKQIFLVRVLTGITVRCPPDGSLRAPPRKSDHPSSLYASGSMFEDERYDSVSGITGDSEVFVTYEHGRSYPAYLITFT